MRSVRVIVAIGICMMCFQTTAQLNEYNQERLKIDKRLMLTLGSWAGTNLATGAVGWATSPVGEAHYFHQMNFFWNTVNLALAVPGYLKARNESTDLSLANTLRAQNKTETIFLINSGLDIGYMSAGLILRSEAKVNPEKRDQWTGYGNSLIMQGGFLFFFDIAAHIIHKRHYKNHLDGRLDQIELSKNGLGIQWNIPPTSTYTRKSFL